MPRPARIPRTAAPRTQRPTGIKKTIAPRHPKTRAPVFTRTRRPSPYPRTNRPTHPITDMPTKVKITRAPVPPPTFNEKQLFRMYRENYDKTLVWLMGYPFTGLGATMKIVEQGTMQSMATNYGDHLEDGLGNEFANEFKSEVIDEVLFPDGPFWHNKDLERNSKVLLIKTNCGGTCLPEKGVNCTINDYGLGMDEIEQALSFKHWAEKCHSGRKFIPDQSDEQEQQEGTGGIEQQEGTGGTEQQEGTGESEAEIDATEGRHLGIKYRKNHSEGKMLTTTPYPTGKLVKAVVMVRNPFALIASRFRNYAKNDEVYMERYFNAKGLEMWCTQIDEKHGGMGIFSHLTRRQSGLLAKVPCWTELYRVVYWYKNTCRMLKAIDHHVVHFEDYIKTPEATVNALMHFVGLQFVPGKEIFFDMNAPKYQWFDEEKMPFVVEYLEIIMRNTDCVKHMFARYLSDSEEVFGFSN